MPAGKKHALPWLFKPAPTGPYCWWGCAVWVQGRQRWCGVDILIKARFIGGSSLHQYEKDHSCMSLSVGEAVALNTLKSMPTEPSIQKYNTESASD